MAAAVSRQEINLTPAHFAADQAVRWRPERGLDLNFGRARAVLPSAYKPLPPMIPIAGDSFFISESLRDLLRKTEKMESG